VNFGYLALLPMMRPPTWDASIGGRPAHVAKPQYGTERDRAVTCPTGVRREVRSVAIEANGLLTMSAVICGPHLGAGNAAVDRLMADFSFDK
jgi:hypothetical protein